MHTLEITVQRQTDEGWPVVVEQNAPGTFLPVRDEGLLRLDLTELRSQSTSRDYGTYLGQALFRDDVRDAFVTAYANSDGGLRLLLAIEDPTLKTLRWERLCAPLDGRWEFLILSQRVPFSFYLPSLTDRRFPPFGRRDLRALVLIASPNGLDAYRLAPFDVQATVASVRAALGNIPHDLLATVEGAAGPPTLDALCTHLTAQPYTLVHVVCHGQFRRGDGDTVVYLEKPDQQVDPVDGERLLQRLSRLQGARGFPHLAFLATCESALAEAEGALGGLAQRLVRELGMPAVIAMTERVSIVTAQALAAGFYQRLRVHGEVDRGLVEATAGLAERYDITVPALYSRLGGRPLFSDAVDRPLTPLEVDTGLTHLETLLAERAPVLLPAAQTLTAHVRATLGADTEALSTTLRQERQQSLAEVNALCGEALDLSFNALALGQEPPAYDGRCPFRGLYPFHSADREFFFGRETLIVQLQQRLTEYPFLAVLGPSGSGKSSLVLAGLVPALQAKDPELRLASMTPGSAPRATLDACLTPVRHERVVLVVDQGEELFTLCADEAQRTAFIDRLLGLTATLPVVLTMRADFWGECAPYPALKDAMQAHQELIAPMQAAELRRAIERQAAQVGLHFEADLSQTILDDAQGEPGAMPLLQHALLELWKRRRGRWLRAEEYRALGGVQQAIARTADEVYERLAPTERDRVRAIFARLTRLDADTATEEGRRDTRQRVGLLELVPAGSDLAATKTLVEHLADARLLVTSVHPVTGREEVEVAHEALIRSWPRLRRWLDEDHLALRVLAGIREAALDWEAAQREESLLVHRGNRLQLAVALLRNPRLTLNALERAYLDACMAWQERERAVAEAQRQRELEAARQLADEQRQRAEVQSRAARNLRILAGGLAVVFLLAVGVATVAYKAQQRAQSSEQLAQDRTAQAVAAQAQATNERDRATQQARLATSRQLAAHAHNRLHEARPALALLLSLEAYRLAPTLESRQALLSGLVYEPRLLTFLYSLRGRVETIAVSPDGTMLAAGAGETVCLWHLGTQQPVGSPLEGHIDVVLSVAYSPQGSVLASRSSDEVLLWDMRTYQLLGRLSTGHESNGDTLAFSPDGTLLATESGSDILLWDVALRQPFGAPLHGHTADVTSVAFSPDGALLASGSWDTTVRLWDMTTRQPLGPPLQGPSSQVESVAFSPDGALLAAGSEEGIQLWDVATRQALGAPLVGHTDVVKSLAFSPDGRILASGSAALDNTIGLWDVARRQQFGPPLVGHNTRASYQVTFNTDGKTLVSSGGDETIVLWDVTTRHRLARAFTGAAGAVESVTLSPNGALLAAGSCRLLDRDEVCHEGEVRLWEVATGNLYGAPLTGYPGEVWQVAFSPDSATVMAGGCAQYDGSSCIRVLIQSWEVATGQPRGAPRSDMVPRLDSLAFSPDGTLMAGGGCSRTTTSCDQGALWRWEVATGTRRGGALVGHQRAVLNVAFSPDGTTLASGTRDDILLWDVASGHVRLGPLRGRHPAWSPDGTTLASVFIEAQSKVVVLRQGATGQIIGQPFTNLPDAVRELLFSPDGQTLVATGTDLAHPQEGFIMLLDVATRRPLGPPLRGHTAQVLSLAFHPAGAALASGSEDTSVLLWDVSLASWHAQACRLANRNFTRAEWQHYLGAEPYQQTCPALPPAPEGLATPVIAQDAALAQTGDFGGVMEILQGQLTVVPRGWEGTRDASAQLQKLVLEGWNLAVAGRVDRAVVLFQKAFALRPWLNLDPEVEARKLAAPGRVARGQRLAERGRIPEALAMYAQAQQFDPALQIPAAAWQTLCWFGSLWGQAAEVMVACDRAVALEPDNRPWRISRGLARAMTGNRTGALEDWQVCTTPQDTPLCVHAQRWSTLLQAGENPFTPDELTRLRQP
jgi:WD40 repeat protein